MYRGDYRHCDWYHKIYLYQQSHTAPVLLFPYTLEYTAISACDALNLGLYVPRHDPAPAWLDQGSDLKTPKSFRENLSEILNIARNRGERVLLMTFAYDIPRDTNGRCLPENPDEYSDGESLLAIWGRPDNVVAGIDSHNAVVRRLHEEMPELLFVDQQGKMPMGPDYYVDCCHLTRRGCEHFVRNIFDSLDKSLTK
jgi:hypothetical protein